MLPVEEKMLELIVKNQLLRYVEANNINFSQQSGFRSSYFYETALNLAFNEWKEDLQLEKVIGIILLDLKRAFETID
jgi:hypothetical protein